MKALSEAEIRASFVNCSRGEAKRLNVPRDLDNRPWDDLDFLGWADPGASDRTYLVASINECPVGITMRSTSHRQSFLRRSMCSLCYTNQGGSGVSLMTARKAGAAGRNGTSAGIHICTDLACSLYVRGKKTPASGSRMQETLSVDEQILRMMLNLEGFLRGLEVPVG